MFYIEVEIAPDSIGHHVPGAKGVFLVTAFTCATKAVGRGTARNACFDDLGAAVSDVLDHVDDIVSDVLDPSNVMGPDPEKVIVSVLVPEHLKRANWRGDFEVACSYQTFKDRAMEAQGKGCPFSLGGAATPILV